ncbi:unnamed protein product [Discula destructiva]
MMRSKALLGLATRPACLRQHTVDCQTIFSRPRRSFTVLGIETSADDTCVALMEMGKTSEGLDTIAKNSVHHKVSCPNQIHKGIHPVEAVASHTQHLSRLVSLVTKGRGKPDLISVTRGPGMGGCLSVGVTTAKALADVWNVPIIGVHHMQAHALSPFMAEAMRRAHGHHLQPLDDEYPMLTLLATGKHTMLVHTKSSVSHRILASTETTALGHVLDKIARELVPQHLIPSGDAVVCYPAIMEDWLGLTVTENYKPPPNRAKEIEVYQSPYTWNLQPPLRKTREMKYNFTSLCGRTLAIFRERPEMAEDERKTLAAQTMRIAFEHLMSRVFIALEEDQELLQDPPKRLVLSGGVASNRAIGSIALRSLAKRGYGQIKMGWASKQWCTDNAAMIAYTGYKMYEDGWQTNQSFGPVAKWSIEEILTGVNGWIRRPGFAPVTSKNPPQPEEASSNGEVGDTTPELAQTPAPPSKKTTARKPLKNADALDDALAKLIGDAEAYLKQFEAKSGKLSTHKVSHEVTSANSPAAPGVLNPAIQAEGSAVASSRQHGTKAEPPSAATTVDGDRDRNSAPTNSPSSPRTGRKRSRVKSDMTRAAAAIEERGGHLPHPEPAAKENTPSVRSYLEEGLDNSTIVIGTNKRISASAPQPESASKPDPKPDPRWDLKPEPKPDPKSDPKPEPELEPELEPKPAPKLAPRPERKAERKPQPKPQLKPELKQVVPAPRIVTRPHRYGFIPTSRLRPAPLYHQKVWPTIPTGRDRHAIKVRLLRNEEEEEPAAAAAAKKQWPFLTVKIASVFAGWLGRK